jgi:hypothetical protein
MPTPNGSQAVPTEVTLRELMNTQQRAAEALHARLRGCLAEEVNRYVFLRRQENDRRRQQLEKAFELRAQGDAKLELLVQYFERFHWA